MHLYSSLLRKCQHQTKQLWRGFSHRTEGGPWPQKGVLTYFLASQPLLMPGGPSPPTKQKVCPLLQKGKLPDTHFSCSFAAWLWGEPQAHQRCTAPQASSRCRVKKSNPAEVKYAIVNALGYRGKAAKNERVNNNAVANYFTNNFDITMDYEDLLRTFGVSTTMAVIYFSSVSVLPTYRII